MQIHVLCMPIMDWMSTPIVFYFFTFVVRENEILISVIRDSLFSLFMNRATDPHVRPSFMIVWDTFCIGKTMTCDLCFVLAACFSYIKLLLLNYLVL